VIEEYVGAVDKELMKGVHLENLILMISVHHCGQCESRKFSGMGTLDEYQSLRIHLPGLIELIETQSFEDCFRFSVSCIVDIFLAIPTRNDNSASCYTVFQIYHGESKWKETDVDDLDIGLPFNTFRYDTYYKDLYVVVLWNSTRRRHLLALHKNDIAVCPRFCPHNYFQSRLFLTDGDDFKTNAAYHPLLRKWNVMEFILGDIVPFEMLSNTGVLIGP
jgi:hypothetical protein